MADLPIIYTVRLDMSQDVEEESNRWNNTNHISDLLGSGFLSAVRFRSIKGEPKYLHLYELPGLELLSTEAYANVRKNDTWGPKLSHGFSNHSASLYEQVLAVNAAETPRTFTEPRDPAKSMGGVKGKYLITVRIDVASESADEFVKWHQEEHFPIILEAPGFTSARLCRKSGQHPRTPSRDPEWVSIYELDSADAVEHPKVKESNDTDWAHRMHAVTSDVRFSLLERIHPA